jgi:AsmA protein
LPLSPSISLLFLKRFYCLYHRPMRKTTKILLTVFGIVIAVPIIGAAIIAATFDPNEYKPLIIDLVKDKTQRTLSIPGELSLSFFPRIGVELGQTSLSERNSQETFASIDSAQLSVELLPLFSRKLVVDHVLLDGLHARLQRAPDGSTNIDDLLAPEEDQQQSRQVDFAIDGVRVTDANLIFDDRQQKSRIEASNLDLETGRLAEGVPTEIVMSTHLKGSNPQIDANVALKTEVQFDLQKQHYIAEGLELRINGAYADWKDLALGLNGNVNAGPDQLVFGKLEVDARGTQGARTIQAQLASPELAVRNGKVRSSGLRATAQVTESDSNLVVNLTAPAFEGSEQSFTMPAVELDASVKQPQLNAKATLAGTVTGNLEKMLFASPQLKIAVEGTHNDEKIEGVLTTPVSADLQAQLIQLPKLAASFSLPNPGGGQLKLAATGSASADLEREKLATDLKGSLDQSQFDLEAVMKGFTEPSYQFDVAVNEIDIDRYRSAQTQPASAPAPNQPEEPIDLSALKGMTAKGNIRIGSLKAADISASNVRADLHIANGKAEIAPLEARLYGGTLSGSVSATASNPARFAVNQRLTSVDVGPLLKAAMGKEAPIDGKGNVQFNVTAQGATVSELTKTLDGTGEIDLQDGAIRGINIARVIRNARANLQKLSGNAAEQTGVSATEERTDFSELHAGFNIENGVLRNNDLSAKSPLLRIAGDGTVDLVEERLNYLVKATVVSTLKGQGGSDLEALKGLTIPVRLTGPFTALEWKIDVKNLVSQQVREDLKEKKEEVRARAKEEITEQREQVKEKLQEELKDRFKGLLGN